LAHVNKHIVLDLSVIINFWLGTESSKITDELLDTFKGQGVQVWIAASSIATLDYVARNRFKQAGVDPTVIDNLIHQLMENLFQAVEILSAHGFDQKAVYGNAEDFEDAQIAAAARCLGAADICIVSEDKAFDALGEVPVYTPQQALEWLLLPPASARSLPFIDLASQQHRILPEIEKNMATALRHGQYIMGPEVKELEERLALFCGAKHCIALSSGTDALLVAMMALGIGPGDEVITSPFTFIATGEMIALLGAIPVFVDIDEATYNIDPRLIEAAITPKTKAIMPVSLYGQCADFDAINAIAEKHRLPVIEDACQSFGATYKGRKSCALSTIGCTSFFPSKPLGCYGDGGACFTSDDAFATKMRQIMAHGQDRRYHHPTLGINGRLDTLQAAVLLAKMDIFEDEVSLREKIGDRYTELLQGSVITPQLQTGNTSVHAQYTIQVENRDVVQKLLQEKGVPTAVHYPVPLHMQPVFASLNKPEGSFPVAEAASRKVMSLPMHPYLAEVELQFIASAVKDAGVQTC
jgi:UDP-2-acetamido-2-deoxy-ribo-hexuluronate aminotransferase